MCLVRDTQEGLRPQSQAPLPCKYTGDHRSTGGLSYHKMAVTALLDMCCHGGTTAPLVDLDKSELDGMREFVDELLEMHKSTQTTVLPLMQLRDVRCLGLLCLCWGSLMDKMVTGTVSLNW